MSPSEKVTGIQAMKVSMEIFNQRLVNKKVSKPACWVKWTCEYIWAGSLHLSSCLLLVFSVPCWSRLLWTSLCAGVPTIWHCWEHVPHLALHRLSAKLSFWGFPIPAGAQWASCTTATLLQPSKPGWLPRTGWPAAAQLSVSQWVHGHQLLPDTSRTQHGQRLSRV